MDNSEEYEFLNDVGKEEMDIVIQKWAPRKGWALEKAETNAYAWLGRIRRTIQREQRHLNTIYALQKKSPRIRKFTTSGMIPEKPEETEF